MASKSKTKGSTWEREISQNLSKLYNENFRRVPTSGAFVGGKNSSRKASMGSNQIQATKGDIIPPDTWKYWNCEAKNYNELPFHQLVTGKCNQIDTWISQVFDAADQDDLNIILIKISRKGRYVLVQSEHNWLGNSHIAYVSDKHGSWKLFDYDEFWSTNVELVKEISEKSS